jgi:hypothetical protein
VFAWENGEPIRPERVLRRFRVITEAAGLPRVRVHDLRHLAASMMIAAGVPLPIVSKTLRHSTVSITADTQLAHDGGGRAGRGRRDGRRPGRGGGGGRRDRSGAPRSPSRPHRPR